MHIEHDRSINKCLSLCSVQQRVAAAGQVRINKMRLRQVEVRVAEPIWENSALRQQPNEGRTQARGYAHMRNKTPEH